MGDRDALSRQQSCPYLCWSAPRFAFGGGDEEVVAVNGQGGRVPVGGNETDGLWISFVQVR